VAAVKIKDGKVVDTFESLINCGRESHPAAYAVHGIGLKELKSAPKPAEVFSKFADFVDGQHIVAHNGNGFDHYILRTELLRNGICMPDCKLIDSLLIAGSLRRPPNRLADLCQAKLFWFLIIKC
jgi:DNA polymerase-3 subunit epsilon